MKSTNSASKEVSALTVLLKKPSTTGDLAVDAIVEFIWARRRNGWSLYDVTLSLIELMQEAPPSLDESFDHARKLTFLPHHTDLTPSLGPFSLSRSSSRQQVAATLSRCPSEIPVEHAREVVLEWSLAMENKLALQTTAATTTATTTTEPSSSSSGHINPTSTTPSSPLHSTSSENFLSGHGIGGKGSLGSNTFAEMAHKHLTMISLIPHPHPSVLALALSVRMSLGYMNLDEVGGALGASWLGLREGEEVLRIWVRRRVEGDGRWGVGKSLEALENRFEKTRPALKSVIRMVKRKFLLPSSPTYRIPLPAPNKSKSLALLQQAISSSSSQTPHLSSLPSEPPSPTSTRLPHSQSDLAAYALELISEYVTREKRDHMRLERWIKSGRKQLSKELDEMEDKVCFPLGRPGGGGKKRSVSSSNTGLGQGQGQGGTHNDVLLPVFEVIRRVHALQGPPGDEPCGFTPFTVLDEGEKYAPPTVQTITSALYVHPRLDTDEAVGIIMELVDHEKDIRLSAVRGAMRREGAGEDMGMGEERRGSEDTVLGALAWGPVERARMGKVLGSIERRFPDGEYREAFDAVRSKNNEGANLGRAPSYTTIASVKTEQRTNTFLSGTSHRPLGGIPPLPTLSSPIETRQEPSLSTSPTGVEVLDDSSPRRGTFERMNSAPSDRIPGMLGNAIRKMSISNRELSSIATGETTYDKPQSPVSPSAWRGRVSESLGGVPMTTSDSQTSMGTEGTLDDIYSGYGQEVIQPREQSESPVQTMPPFTTEQPLASPSFSRGSPVVMPIKKPMPTPPPDLTPTPAPPSKRKVSILRRPGFLGGSRSDKQNNDDRKQSKSNMHRATASLSTIPQGDRSSGQNTPARRINQNPPAGEQPSPMTSSPASWRAEFSNMNNGMGMLRPSPRHVSSSSLSGLTGQQSTRTTPR